MVEQTHTHFLLCTSILPFPHLSLVLILPREPVDEVLQMPPSLLNCGGCQQSIGDRFFLKAIEKYWHEDCLSCDLCGCRLGEVGRRLYYKLGRKLCRRDYLRLDTLQLTFTICPHPKNRVRYFDVGHPQESISH